MYEYAIEVLKDLKENLEISYKTKRRIGGKYYKSEAMRKSYEKQFSQLQQAISKLQEQSEVIAEGKVRYTKLKNINQIHYKILNVGGASFNGIIRDSIEEHLGKKVKISIQKCKESK